MSCDLLSVSQVAGRVHLTVQAVRKALKEERLIGTKVGHFWVICKSDVKRWRDWEAVR